MKKVPKKKEERPEEDRSSFVSENIQLTSKALMPGLNTEENEFSFNKIV